MASMFGIDEVGIPGHRVGDAVDVIPAAGVEADEVLAERGADLHQLETRFDLFDEHVNLDRAVGQAKVLLERGDRCRSRARLLRRSGSSAGTAPARSRIRAAARGC